MWARHVAKQLHQIIITHRTERPTPYVWIPLQVTLIIQISKWTPHSNSLTGYNHRHGELKPHLNDYTQNSPIQTCTHFYESWQFHQKSHPFHNHQKTTRNIPFPSLHFIICIESRISHGPVPWEWVKLGPDVRTNEGTYITESGRGFTVRKTNNYAYLSICLSIYLCISFHFLSYHPTVIMQLKSVSGGARSTWVVLYRHCSLSLSLS